MRTSLVLSKLSIASLAALTLALASGCSAAPIDVSTEQALADSKAPSRAVGRYENQGKPGFDDFLSLTLNDDGTAEGVRTVGTERAKGTWREDDTAKGGPIVTIVIGSRTSTFRMAFAASSAAVTLIDTRNAKHALTRGAALGELGGMCGGLAGIACANAAHECVLRGAYPDASGTCTAKAPAAPAAN